MSPGKTAVTSAKNQKKPIVITAIVAAVALILVVGFTAVFVLRPKLQQARLNADKRLKILENEFTQIAPLPNASQVRYESSHKINLGSVSADYGTQESYVQIRTHYDKELKKNGWTFVGARPVTIWGRDYGGKMLYYCKDHNAASLQYAGGSEEGFGWTYNFNLSWGLVDECQ